MKLKYKEVIALGFVRNEVNDSVYFDTHGVQYIITQMQFKYNKCDYIFDWCQRERTVKLMKCDKQGRILISHMVQSIEQLKILIEWLK